MPNFWTVAPPLTEAALFKGHDDSLNEDGQRSTTNYYQRSEAVRQYVLARADGVCEGCNQPAPFMNKKGKPYLDPHHIRRLTDGGPDDPRYIIGLCPNCHREVHMTTDRCDRTC